MKTETFTNRPSGLTDMTQGYDPAYSYVVIEQRVEGGGRAGFERANQALSGLAMEIVDQELVTDPSTGECRLVIKMKQQETEAILLALLGTDLKENYHCYVY